VPPFAFRVNHPCCGDEAIPERVRRAVNVPAKGLKERDQGWGGTDGGSGEGFPLGVHDRHQPQAPTFVTRRLRTDEKPQGAWGSIQAKLATERARAMPSRGKTPTSRRVQVIKRVGDCFSSNAGHRQQRLDGVIRGGQHATPRASSCPSMVPTRCARNSPVSRHGQRDRQEPFQPQFQPGPQIRSRRSCRATGARPRGGFSGGGIAGSSGGKQFGNSFGCRTPPLYGCMRSKRVAALAASEAGAGGGSGWGQQARARRRGRFPGGLLELRPGRRQATADSFGSARKQFRRSRRSGAITCSRTRFSEVTRPC